MKKIIQERTDYPFAASAINVSRIVLYHLKIVETKQCPCCGTDIMKNYSKNTPELKDFMIIIENDYDGTALDEIIAVLVFLKYIYIDDNYG